MKSFTAKQVLHLDIIQFAWEPVDYIENPTYVVSMYNPTELTEIE